MRAGVILGLTSLLLAQAPSDPTNILAEARDKMLDTLRRLPRYTCLETVTRRYFQRQYSPVGFESNWITVSPPAPGKDANKWRAVRS